MHTLGASAAVHKLAVRQQGPLLPSGGWANGTFSGIEIATTSKIASSGFSSGELPLPTVTAGPSIVIPMGTGNLPAPPPTTSFEAQLPPYFPDGPPFTPTRPTAATSVANSSAASVAEDVASISSAVQSAASAAEEDVSTFDSVSSAGESATSGSVPSTIPSTASATESSVVLVTVVPILQSAGYAEAVPVAAGDSVTTIIRTTYITVISNAIVTTSDSMIVIVPATATATPTFEMTTTVVPLGPNSVTLTVPISTTVTVDEDVNSTTTSWTTVTQSAAHQTTLNYGTTTVTPTVFVTRTTGTAGYPTGTAISYLAIQTGTGPAFNFTVLAAPYTNNTNPNAATEVKPRTALLGTPLSRPSSLPC